MSDTVLPATADEVVDLLDRAFPERCPSIDWPDRKVWVETGKREVVRYLRELQRRANDNLLEQDL